MFSHVSVYPSINLSVHTLGGGTLARSSWGGYPGQVQLGGGLAPARGEYPLLGGYPTLGTPCQTWLGGTPPQVPPCQTWGGTQMGGPHLRYPPSDLARGYPTLDNRSST